jgi:penicillin amidase
MLNRILRYLNLAILIVLLLAAIAVYWIAWRPLPQTSGFVTVPIGQRATVVRDALGVPHIAAATVEDALFLQGYVTAQDRLWQMDALRRFAAGQLAEVLGPQLLESDREARRFRMDRIAGDQAARLPAADRSVLAAYARGVNCFIETHRGRLPLEFTLLRYDPRPWTIKDSVLIALNMYRELTVSWRDKLIKSAMLAGGGDPAKLDVLFPPRLGGVILPGSNAWVLAGSRTATGRPLLANDPHLQYSIPSVWHMVHLRAPGLDASGVAFPGLPCVILGHNDRIAWGSTNLGFDVQDLYAEKIDLRTGRYVYRGQIEQARLEREFIPVKGQPPVELSQWVTRHGPVFTDRGRALALRWTAAEPGSFALPFLDLDRARGWGEFLAALARFPGPAQNFVYADAGHIGYHVAGLLPIRKGYAGDVPVDGSSGDNEWAGYVPFDQLPHTYDPKSGLIVTANQNPFPPDYPYPVRGEFAAPDRAERIQTLLTARSNWHTVEMLGVQTDVYSAFGHDLARRLVAAYDRRTRAGESGPAIAYLRPWDGRMTKGIAPLIVTLTYDHLRQAIADRAAPGQALLYGGQEARGAAYMAAPAIVRELLEKQPRDWFGDYDGLLLRCLRDAIDEGSRLQGRSMARWDYGKYNELLIAHPVGGRLPLVGGYFNIGPVEHDGSPTTVMQTTRRIGPSMRTAVDLSDLDKSYMNIVAGESGQILSGHYKDQWDAYYAGRSFPMQVDKVDAKDTLVFEPAKE